MSAAARQRVQTTTSAPTAEIDPAINDEPTLWLTAENMLREAYAAVAEFKRQESGRVPPVPVLLELPAALPIARVRALAAAMWDEGGRGYDRILDCWLAAQRHVIAVTRALAAKSTEPEAGQLAEILDGLSPSEYVAFIRLSAYYAWEKAAKADEYPREAFDYWLHAEQSLLRVLEAVPRPMALRAP